MGERPTCRREVSRDGVRLIRVATFLLLLAYTTAAPKHEATTIKIHAKHWSAPSGCGLQRPVDDDSGPLEAFCDPAHEVNSAWLALVHP